MSLKKKIGGAILSTALGATLIGGGTFAIFTSSASNTNNTFAAGTLTINLDQQDPTGAGYFTVNNMAPGDKNGVFDATKPDNGLKRITVSNSGSLELRYDIATTLTGALAEQDPDGDGPTTGDGYPLTITIYDKDGNVITPNTDNNRVLAPSSSEDLYVKYELPKDAGNGYQGKSATFGITVNAEQTANN
ncbi:TasA family protein [Neobacillus sp. SAB-20_R2A]|uniref:TasA family protein n=1 Tax=Neobacillus sp. SAB-20_R2A TaxID=3120519 RepID=UPI003C6DD149